MKNGVHVRRKCEFYIYKVGSTFMSALSRLTFWRRHYWLSGWLHSDI